MATRKEEVEKLARHQGSLYRAAEDEPIFILRAQDKFYVPLVRMWIELVGMDTPQPLSDPVGAKLLEAVELANQAIDWQSAHRSRVKVPD